MKKKAIKFDTLEKHPLLAEGAFEMVSAFVPSNSSAQSFLDQYRLMRVHFLDELPHFGSHKYAALINAIEEQDDRLVMTLSFDYATAHHQIYSSYDKKRIAFCGVVEDSAYKGISSFWTGLSQASDGIIAFGTLVNSLYFS